MSTEKNYEEILDEISEKINNMDTIKEIDLLNIKDSLESIENLMTDSETKSNFEEIKTKLDTVAMQVDNCNEALLKDLYNDINQLKETSTNVSQHLENLQNLQNLSLTSAQFEEYQKQQLDLALKTNENIFNELSVIKENSGNINNAENIKNLNSQITNLHNVLTEYIEQLVAKMDEAPNLEQIGSVVSDLNSVQQKNIKQTKTMIKELQDKFVNFQSDFKYKEIENQLSKISEIYDSLNIIIVWTEKVGLINKSIENVYARLGQSIDFDDVSEKVDIIYKNIDSLSNKLQKIDNIDSAMTNTQSKLSSLSTYLDETKNISTAIANIKNRLDSTLTDDIDLEDISNKMDIVYENLTAINEWAGKIDNVNEKIDNVSEKVDNFDDEMLASKVDIIYENIGLLNEWVSKIDNLSQRSEELDNKFNRTNDNLNVKIDEITQTLANASKIMEDVPNIKDKLEDLSGELNVITRSTKDDTESYIYTLLDIESDFLKLHKFLDDKTQVTTNDINSLKEKFAEITDDISSISIRTNKLILSADDANKEFKSYLETFKNTIKELEIQRQQYNPEYKLSVLEEKTDKIMSLMQGNLETVQSLKNAFVFLAEWVDTTGNMLNNMNNNLNILTNSTKGEVQSEVETKLEAIENTVTDMRNEEISELKSLMTGIMVQLNTSLTPDIDSINARIDKAEEENEGKFSELETIMKDKINQQAKQILSLEQKLTDMNTRFDKLIDIMSEDNHNYEIKDILNYIATQTAATNEAVTAQRNSDEIINAMSEKLSSFDTNINKIVSYIEED